MDARFEWNKPALEQRKRRKKEAHLALDTAIIQDTTPSVPMVTGMLASSPLRSRKVGTITYDTPYARRLYYSKGYNFTKTFHAQAGSHWFKRAKPVWYTKWQRIVEQLLKGK